MKRRAAPGAGLGEFTLTEDASTRLVKIGATTWVSLDAVQGVEWDALEGCPEVVLSCGRSVHATGFTTRAGEDAGVRVEALLRLLVQQSEVTP